MKWRNALIIVAVILLMVPVVFSQNSSVKQVPIKNVPAADGQQMYAAYCASCHGADGRGGPAALSLRRAPADLTQLSRQNQGRYPSLRVQQTILASTHSSEMPQWRGLFYSLCPGNRMAEAETMARGVNLARYVETLQR
ncbi:MAG: cytochrome c [Acidobacteriota bacterium]|nr:cytochrome c [Acidobacteriota bacterium]